MKINKNFGFSLIEILVAIGLMAVASVLLLNMLTGQQKELQSVDEKMSLQSLQMQIQTMLTNGNYCLCLMNTSSFNSITNVWNTMPTTMASSYSAACAPIGAPLLIVGTKIGNSRLVPTAIAMQNISEIIAGSGEYSAGLVVQFDQTQLVRASRDLTVPFRFKLNMADPPAARQVISCSSSGTSGGSGACSWVDVSPGPNPRFGTAMCPGSATVKGFRSTFCDPDASPSDYCFSIYCCD